MQIDIRTVLRKLLCVGVPLLGGAGCSGETMNAQGNARSGPASQPGVPGQTLAAERCTERMLVPATAGAPAAKEKAALVITADDDRWSDFYEACLARQHLCTELCRAAVDAGRPAQPGYGNSVATCGLSSCTEQGRPVLYVTYGVSSLAAVGRRPEGFAYPALGDGEPCGAWLARAAALEAASIPAFARMARELEGHGAPAALVARARAAMADEARHFRVTRQLARAYGADVERPGPAPVAARPMVDMAIENIAEGCVNETFAALLALWQSTHAGDPRVRLAMAGIAEDETRHAQLSWDVADFLMSRLAADETRAVAAAFADATGALAQAAAAPVDAALVDRLGLPDAAAMAGLAAGLRASLPPYAGRPEASFAAST